MLKAQVQDFDRQITAWHRSSEASTRRDEIPGASYQKALHRLRRLSDRDVPEYLLHCLQYYSWSGRFVAEVGETTIPHLPAERLRAMLFPFPPPRLSILPSWQAGHGLIL